MAFSDRSPSGRYILGVVVGLVAGGVGCFLMLFPVAAWMGMIIYLFGPENAGVEAQRNILLGTYAVWFGGFTLIGTLAEKGPFLSGFFASLPVAAVWLIIAWQSHGPAI
jgi:hypothetical protein